MSKPDWGKLQERFLSEHTISGISPKDWSEAQGLNYASARRYIKKPPNTAQKALRNTAQNGTAQATAQKSKQATPSRVAASKNKSKTAQKTDPGRSAFCAELKESESLFVAYYLERRNKYEAYRRAGYTGGDRNARMLYRKPAIAKAINQGIEQLSDQAILNAQDIFRHWHEIAIADPGEISQMRRVCCRYCWGIDHHYQWIDDAEYSREEAKAARDNRPPPDQSGGFDFILNEDPNPECPKCAGEGVENVYLADTRDLVGPARRLIAGVKRTKLGIEVTTRDQDAALKNLASFHNLASSERDRELRLLQIERVRLSNEKLKAEIEKIRTGDKEGSLIVVHNALQIPGAVQPTHEGE